MSDRKEMIEVVFLRECHLPRFTMKAGEKWKARAKRLSGKGLEIGGGIADRQSFKILVGW